MASQEAIKELGTNGGGFYNANSAHPFENPTALDELAGDLPAAADPVQPAAHLRPDGRRQPAGLRDRRRDGASWRSASVALINVLELAHHGTVPQAVGAAMEGKETRFGVSDSATFAAATTLTSTGAVNSLPRLLHRARRRR